MAYYIGHISVKGMKMLVVKRALEGVKSVDMSFCESCIVGK